MSIVSFTLCMLLFIGVSFVECGKNKVVVREVFCDCCSGLISGKCFRVLDGVFCQSCFEAVEEECDG